MPWWSWVVIWVVLVLALLGMFALLGYRLFRKAMATLTAFGELADKAEILEQRVDDLNEAAFQPAIFADASELSQKRREARAARERKRQAHRERKIERGRLLVKADPQQFTHLLKRT